MKTSVATSLVLTLVLGASLTACARTSPASAQSPAAAAASPRPGPTAAASPTVVPAKSGSSALPTVLVHKSASCGCCGSWVEHLRKEGFIVEVRNQDDLNPIKQRVGVPLGKGSCHTAEVGGYFVEGHVPAGDVKRLLAQTPDAKGLVLPGMPAGSPGMETQDGSIQAYTVELVGRDGTVRPFAQHAARPAQ